MSRRSLVVSATSVAVLAAFAFAPARRPPETGLVRWSASGGRPAGAAHLEPRGVRPIIRAEFGRGWLGRCMTAIAWRESRLRPRAVNWSDVHSDGSRGSFGLFQIGAVHRGRLSVARFARIMLDPRANARIAHVLYFQSGLTPWGGRCG